jgi:hypothetical protein
MSSYTHRRQSFEVFLSDYRLLLHFHTEWSRFLPFVFKFVCVCTFNKFPIVFMCLRIFYGMRSSILFLGLCCTHRCFVCVKVLRHFETTSACMRSEVSPSCSLLVHGKRRAIPYTWLFLPQCSVIAGLWNTRCSTVSRHSIIFYKSPF